MLNLNNNKTPETNPQHTPAVPVDQQQTNLNANKSPVKGSEKSAQKSANTNQQNVPANETPEAKDLRLKAEAKRHQDDELKARHEKLPPQRNIIEFLQQISQKIKSSEPKHFSVADDIDAYIRDHGNRFPETTRNLNHRDHVAEQSARVNVVPNQNPSNVNPSYDNVNNSNSIPNQK